MENCIVEAVNEMKNKNFSSIDEARKIYTDNELFDFWVRYEGLGDSDRIISVFGVLNPKHKQQCD